jgi:hypothetical protein
MPTSVAGLSIVALAMIAMLIFSWRCWPDPIADFGRELYVPWQLAQRKVLYRDIAYFNGPLSPFFNAILFRAFGASLMALAWANIAILGAVVVMLHRIAARIGDEFAATVACLAFVILLAIGQPGPVANYNFITPYSHEMTHGFALALAAILCLMKYAQSKGTIWIVLCGFALGLTFLTKPEVFFAAGVACAVGTTLYACRFRVLSMLLGTALLPPIVAIAFCGTAAIGGWRWAFDPALVDQPFYKIVRGTDDIGRSIGLIASIGAGFVIVLGIPVLIGLATRLRGSKRMIAAGASFALVSLGLGAFHRDINWPEIGRPLILVTAVIVIALSIRMARPEHRSNRATAQLIFATFAFVLLLKIALHVLLYHYGFVLAAPALVLAIVAAECWIPGWINRRGACGAFVRFGSLGAIFVTCIVYLSYASNHFYGRQKLIIVGSGANAFYTNARGQAVNEMLVAISTLPPNQTLAVVPQGAMINFLSRCENPTPFIVLMPPELIMFGDDRITESYSKNPPDLLLIIKSDLSEYGYSSFPQYAPKLAKWIDAHYTSQASAPSWALLRRNP